MCVLPGGKNDGFHGVVVMPHCTQERVRLREVYRVQVHDDHLHGDDLVPWYRYTDSVGLEWLPCKLQGNRTTSIDKNVKPVDNIRNMFMW